GRHAIRQRLGENWCCQRKRGTNCVKKESHESILPLGIVERPPRILRPILKESKESFSDAERGKDSAQHVVGRDAAENASQRVERFAKLQGDEFLACVDRSACAVERRASLGDQL